MSDRRNRWIVGTALSLAAIAVAIDHTKHRLPDPVEAEYEIVGEDGGSPCGLDASPCGMGDESPCGMDGSPCGLDGSPCGLDGSPCGLV